MPDQISSQLRIRATPPILPPRLVPRRNLTDRLHRGSTRQLTLISAGAGSGKTLTVASWLADGAFPGAVAWLTANETDNDLRTFWADMLSALAIGDLAAGSGLRELVPAGRFGDQELLRVRAGLAELPVPAVLVLDDFHHVRSIAVLESLNTVLDERHPPNLRLVLITRADPALRLHRLRVGGGLTEIRAQDLQFTQREAAELFQLNDLALSDDQLRVLLDRTQGWSVGLRLAAMSLSSTEDISTEDIAEGIARFTGTHQSVAEYLIVEVLNRLPPANRDFMLRTSIAERLSAPLATALTGRQDSQSTLEAMVAANAFMVTLGGQGSWFRLHPLLRDLLQHRLAVEQPGMTHDLHLLASQWFASHGEPLQAIRHATTAQDWDEVGRLLTTNALPLILTPAGPALAAALEPAAMRASAAPSLCTLLSAATWHYLHREFESMHQDAQDAAPYLDAAPDEIRVPAEVLLTMITMAHDRITAGGTLVASATALLSLLDRVPRRLVPAAPHYRMIGVSNVGVGHLWSGDLPAADTNLTAAAGRARELGSGLSELSMEAHLSILEVIHGQLNRAQRRATAAQEVVDRRGWGNEPHILGLYVARGLTQLGRHQLDAAADTVATGLAASTRPSDTHCRLALGIAAVGGAYARGDRQAARFAAAQLSAEREHCPRLPDLLARWCTVAQAHAQLISTPAAVIDSIDPPAGTSGFATAIERVVLARAHLALGQPHLVRKLLEPLIDNEFDLTYLGPAVDTRILLALAATRENRDNAALTLITEAIDLAQPEGLLQPFLDAGPPAVALVARHRQVAARHRDFTNRLLPTPSAVVEPPALSANEHLTERELIVLRYLPTMLKAAEIAKDLYVTVNTVKSHLRSIYRKLDVATRREAVERARALNLL